MKSRTERETTIRSRRAVAMALTLATFGLVQLSSRALAATPDQTAPARETAATAKVDPKAFPGYTLIAPMNSTTTTLVDLEGKVVHTWQHDCQTAAVTYLLENGHLLRTGMVGGGMGGRGGRGGGRGGMGGPGGGMGGMGGPGGGGGDGGRVQEIAWDGEVVWDYTFASDTHMLHHDVEKLPNGNVLMIAWERKSAAEVTAAGRNRQMGNSDMRPDFIIEVKPTGKTTGEIVWRWNMWDHLIQDYDKTKANYGDVAAHPELINLNFVQGWAEQLTDDQADTLRSLGYLGPRGGGPGGMGGGADWSHTNAVDYNADFDQIMLSIHGFGEIWIIDHSTTTEEAAGHTGGRYGKGGDLLYRWGNPAAYRAGRVADRKLFGQHDSNWIPKGEPGAGHVLIFNNGVQRPDGNYSSVDEVILPTRDDGSYARTDSGAFEPAKVVWVYTAPNKSQLFSMAISGAQRLPNGNTLICGGMGGGLFEVTPEKETVWRYAGSGGGMPGMPGGPDAGPSGPDFQPTWRGGRGGRGGMGGGPGGMGGFPGMGGGPGGFGGMGGFGGGMMFRSYRYAPDYPGLADKNLTSTDTVAAQQAAQGGG